MQTPRAKSGTGMDTLFSTCVAAADGPKSNYRSLALTPKQYVEAIDRLGLSQRDAGAFLGVDERQSRRWVAGDSAIPESVAKLLRLMVRLNLSPSEVR